MLKKLQLKENWEESHLQINLKLNQIVATHSEHISHYSETSSSHLAINISTEVSGEMRGRDGTLYINVTPRWMKHR